MHIHKVSRQKTLARETGLSASGIGLCQPLALAPQLQCHEEDTVTLVFSQWLVMKITQHDCAHQRIKSHLQSINHLLPYLTRYCYHSHIPDGKDSPYVSLSTLTPEGVRKEDNVCGVRRPNVIMLQVLRSHLENRGLHTLQRIWRTQGGVVAGSR